MTIHYTFTVRYESKHPSIIQVDKQGTIGANSQRM